MADNEQKDDLLEKKKKRLINETITGRKLTPGRLIRNAVTAAMCGIVFGLVAAAVFLAANYYAPRLAAGDGNAAEETASKGQAALGEAGITDDEAPGQEVQGGIIPDGSADREEPGNEELSSSGDSSGDQVTAYGDDEEEVQDEGSETREQSDTEDHGEKASSDKEGPPDGEMTGDNAEAVTDIDPERAGNKSDGIRGAADGSDEKSTDGGYEGDREALSAADTGGADVTESEALTDVIGSQGVTDSAGGTGIEEGAGESVKSEEDDENPDYAETFRRLSDIRRRSIDIIDEYIVSVSAITTGTTWFESVVSSSKDYSGLIIDVGEDEVLILTTSEAVGSETLKVTFGNSVSVDAYVKQISAKDSLAVLAVSATNGLDEDMIAEMSAIEFAADEDIYDGEPVIAAGAPFGVVGSHAFGDVGYIDEEQSDYDVEQTILYADIAADTRRGSFIMDYEGRFLGVTVKEIESRMSGEGLTGFVSAASIKDTVERLKAGEAIAYLGIAGTEVTFDMHYNGMPGGVYVTDIETNSPAYDAGIMRGDIVYEIDLIAVTDMDGLSDEIRKHRTEDRIVLKAYRAGADGEYGELEFELTADRR